MKNFAPGFDYEIHRPVTDDDWVLTIFRIIPSKDAMERNGRSVLFQHGAMMDATWWIASSAYSQTEREKDSLLAFFKLADEGYDVWFGNNRAT